MTSAILIQRCANGYLAASPNARDTSSAHVFPDSVATDSTQAVAFMQWLDAETRKSESPNVHQELQGIKQAMDPEPATPSELPLP